MLMLPLSGIEAGAGHLFAQAPGKKKVAFEAADLAVQEVVGLVDQADEDVRYDRTWTFCVVWPESLD
jgi:hypothetical protein